MAENRFKKSINNATENTIENIVENTSENILQNPIYNIEENAVENIVDNILQKVLQDKKNKGRNHTIYLSAEVGEALAKYTKKANKSKSELIDNILREVFKI